MAAYGALLLLAALLVFLRAVALVTANVRACRRVHDEALWAVLRSPMSFFDTTPSGRVLNRRLEARKRGRGEDLKVGERVAGKVEAKEAAEEREEMDEKGRPLASHAMLPVIIHQRRHLIIPVVLSENNE